MSLKQAYNNFPESTFGSPNFTIGDLISAINQDPTLSSSNRVNLVQSVQRQTGFASASTSLKSLMYGSFGAVLGNLIAKYFGMSILGRTLATVSGFGIGGVLGNAMGNKRTGLNVVPGWSGLS
ncbi:hypothetical protein ACFLQL_04060 [Verrucomicrobiota bacterium]